MYTLTCEVCGKVFETKNGRQKCCSHECAGTVKPKTGLPTQCPICKKTFIVSKYRKKYCSDPCAMKAQSQSKREHARRCYEEQQSRKRAQEGKAARAKERAKKMRAIRESGLTYGQYMARQQMEDAARIEKKATKVRKAWREPVELKKCTVTPDGWMQDRGYVGLRDTRSTRAALKPYARARLARGGSENGS